MRIDDELTLSASGESRDNIMSSKKIFPRAAGGSIKTPTSIPGKFRGKIPLELIGWR